MAISTPTALIHDHVATSGSTFTNTSASYTSGRLYLAFCGGSGTTGRTNSSLSGASGTWTETSGGDSTYTDGTTWNVSCFSATDATGSGALTVTYSGNWTASRFIHVYEITSGFDTSGLHVQSVAGNTLPTATSATLALADSAASGNGRFAYFIHRIQETLTAGNGGTMIDQQSTVTPGNNKGLWWLDSDTTSDPNVTWATNTRGAVYIGGEIKASTGGGVTVKTLAAMGVG